MTKKGSKKSLAKKSANKNSTRKAVSRKNSFKKIVLRKNYSKKTVSRKNSSKKAVSRKKSSKKATSRKSTSSKDPLSFSFECFSYRNPVIRYMLIGLTIFALGILICLYTGTLKPCKISGYLGAIPMIYALSLSVINTHSRKNKCHICHVVSDIILAIMIIAFVVILSFY